MPPILIAHSGGVFLGFKYLESHALSGLAAISPVLQRPAAAVNVSEWYQMQSTVHAACIINEYCGLDADFQIKIGSFYERTFTEPINLETGEFWRFNRYFQAY